MRFFSSVVSLALLAALGLASTGCSSSGRSVSITRIKPPVETAVGTKLATTAVVFDSLRASKVSKAITGSTIEDRFFDDGPSNIMDILGDVDGRLTEIETRAAQTGNGACLDAAAVTATVTIFGESVELKLQCYDSFSGTGFMAFGKDGSTWYLYERVGATNTAAKATTLASGKIQVEVWGGVGMSNAEATWDNMSYAGYHLKASTEDSSFEMTAAGVGIGHCGVHLKSDGTNLYAYGSDEGAGTACNSLNSTCVLLSDLTTAGTCTSIGTSSFSLTGLGRKAVAAISQSGTWSASTYPTTANLTINGTSTDDIHFGYAATTALPSGVTAF